MILYSPTQWMERMNSEHIIRSDKVDLERMVWAAPSPGSEDEMLLL